MIDRWCGVSCDRCGTTGEILENAIEARRAARRAGWAVNLPGDARYFPRRDLCPTCRTTPPDATAHPGGGTNVPA